jgi:DNA gyrase subunit A
LPQHIFPALTPELYQQAEGFTEAQAKAILELRLQRLTGMERDKIVEEFNAFSSI